MSRTPTTSEQQFRLYERNLIKQIKRDWFVFRYLLRIWWLWFTVGGRLRKAKRRAAANGEVFYIDHIAGGGA